MKRHENSPCPEKFLVQSVFYLLILFFSLFSAAGATAAEKYEKFGAAVTKKAVECGVRASLRGAVAASGQHGGNRSCLEFDVEYGTAAKLFGFIDAAAGDGIFAPSEISAIEADGSAAVASCKLFIVKYHDGGTPPESYAKRGAQKYSLLKTMIAPNPDFTVDVKGFYYLPDYKIEVTGSAFSVENALRFAAVTADSDLVHGFSELTIDSPRERGRSSSRCDFRIVAVLR